MTRIALAAALSLATVTAAVAGPMPPQMPTLWFPADAQGAVTQNDTADTTTILVPAN